MVIPNAFANFRSKKCSLVSLPEFPDSDSQNPGFRSGERAINRLLTDFGSIRRPSGILLHQFQVFPAVAIVNTPLGTLFCNIAETDCGTATKPLLPTPGRAHKAYPLTA